MNTKKYILALDQGTTSSRAILFDHSGRIQSIAQQEFKQYFPQEGWVEHDAEEIWQTQFEVARQALAATGARPAEVAAIGITNQRETTVVWDRDTGQPVSRAIVWQDRRTSDFCEKLKKQGHAKRIQQKTGLVLDAYFSASKIRWILENVAGARANADAGKLAFGTVDSWLIWNLTEGKQHLTDITNASRTMLYNIHDQCWDKELIKLFEIPENMLPEVRSCSEVYAETDADFLGCEIPVAGIAGDQQAALFGQMCSESGMLKNTYGTGCFIVLNTGDKPVVSQNNLLTTIAWQLGGQVSYALEGSVFIGGAVVQWLRDGLNLIESSSQIESLAKTVDNNGGVYFVPAFTGLGAPHWDQFARGTIIGLTRGTTAGHLARAALEGIAFQTFDVLQAMQQDAGLKVKELRVDGGATANNTLMQFQADILGVPVIRPEILETTALGAAYLAGLAVGFWRDLDDLKEQWREERRFMPAMEEKRIAELLDGWREALVKTKTVNC